jgi:hypothetical protein
VSAREPAEILAELGDALQSASARRRARPAWRRLPLPRRSMLVALAVVFALVPTAVGTHEALFAPEPPALPPELRAPGAVDPSDTGTPVYVAEGVGWRLSASVCEYGAERVVGVFLTVPGGGAGARCDGARPEALAGRRIHTYFDPQTGTSWVFGTLPAAARQVTVAVTGHGAGSAVRVAARPSDPRAVAKGRLPRGLRVFVAELPGAPEVRRVTATGTGGRQVLRCEGGRCSP